MAQLVEFLREGGRQETLGSFPTLGYLRQQATKLTHQRSVGIKGLAPIRLG